MTNQISLEALKDRTVGELIELGNQAQDLPQGFKLTYQKPKTNYAEALVTQLTGIKYKCPNCSRESTHEKELPLKVCGCGYEMNTQLNTGGKKTNGTANIERSSTDL